MRVSSAAGLLASLVLVGSAVPVGAGTDLETLLLAGIDSPRSTSYVGQFESVRFSSNRAAATIVKIDHLAPDRTRRWYVAPESLYGDYVISNGPTAFAFDTHRSKLTVVDKTEPSDVFATGDVRRVLQNFRPLSSGNDDIVADRPTQSIVLVNKYTGERALRLWLDRETHLVLKREAYHGNGSVASQGRFEAIRFTGAIPAALFDPKAPAGYTRVAGLTLQPASTDVDRAIAGAGFTPIEPKRLPQGFAVVGGEVTTVAGIRTLQLVYSDGLRSLSLFENARGAAADFGSLQPHQMRFENHAAQYVEDGPTTLITWTEAGRHFALVGDLLRPELVAIAKSVVP